MVCCVGEPKVLLGGDQNEMQGSEEAFVAFAGLQGSCRPRSSRVSLISKRKMPAIIAYVASHASGESVTVMAKYQTLDCGD